MSRRAISLAGRINRSLIPRVGLDYRCFTSTGTRSPAERGSPDLVSSCTGHPLDSAMFPLMTPAAIRTHWRRRASELKSVNLVRDVMISWIHDRARHSSADSDLSRYASFGGLPDVSLIEEQISSEFLRIEQATPGLGTPCVRSDHVAAGTAASKSSCAIRFEDLRAETAPVFHQVLKHLTDLSVSADLLAMKALN